MTEEIPSQYICRAVYLRNWRVSPDIQYSPEGNKSETSLSATKMKGIISGNIVDKFQKIISFRYNMEIRHEICFVGVRLTTHLCNLPVQLVKV